MVSAGSGASASIPGTCCTGVWPLPALLQAAAMAMRYIGQRMVAGSFLMECWMELLRISVVFRWRQRLQDQVLKGCVPGRWFFLVCMIPSPGAGGYCGSFRSLWAMIMFLISSDHLCGGGFRCPTIRWEDTADPMNLLAISFFHTDLCAVWVEQLPLFLLYPSWWYAYLYEVLYAFVMY